MKTRSLSDADRRLMRSILVAVMERSEDPQGLKPEYSDIFQRWLAQDQLWDNCGYSGDSRIYLGYVVPRRQLINYFLCERCAEKWKQEGEWGLPGIIAKRSNPPVVDGRMAQ